MPGDQLTPEQVKALVTAFKDIVTVLSDADLADKSELYDQLGISLAYDPDGTVTVESQPRGLTVRVGGGTCRSALRDPFDPLGLPRFLTAEARMLNSDLHPSKVRTLQSLGITIAHDRAVPTVRLRRHGGVTVRRTTFGWHVGWQSFDGAASGDAPTASQLSG